MTISLQDKGKTNVSF